MNVASSTFVSLTTAKAHPTVSREANVPVIEADMEFPVAPETMIATTQFFIASLPVKGSDKMSN